MEHEIDATLLRLTQSALTGCVTTLSARHDYKPTAIARAAVEIAKATLEELNKS